MDVAKIFLTTLMSYVYFFRSANGAFCGDPVAEYPEITPETELITCHLSVTSLADGPFPGVDHMSVKAPVNASVTQIMLLAEKHSGGDFWFESDYHENFGTYVHTINGLSNDDPYYWFLYDVMDDGQTNCGTDFTRARDNDHFHWLYEEYTYGYY
ncbi:hypothetical protein HOLleu_10892 [Holothuria leucospilota]|uniref:DUF4430 domain-containing protein n=1 Tax=Holothuria leucospilota TaxID=206669 RepID=A0A9Q1CFC4_HOLLE|nr:hypothetical protein HOLleu_10892 [Holothuria leucospilota]